MRARMRLGVVAPLWKRPELTSLTLRRIATAAACTNHQRLVAIVDPADDVNAASARSWGFELVRAPNEPLSDKKNAGVQYLRGRVDGVVFLGSDDWPVALGQTSFFDIYAALLEEHDAVGVLDCWYLDAATGRGLYSAGYRQGSRRFGEPIGVGRALSWRALDAVDWAPRPSGLAKNHDGGMRRKLEERGIRFVGFQQESIGVRLVDIKSAESVTPFRLLRGRRTAFEEVMAPYPDPEVDALRDWMAAHG